MIDIEHFFAESGQEIDAVLDKLVPSADLEPVRLHEAIRWSLFAGGKRFRPVLVLTVGRTFGADESKLLRTAAAVEMIHTYSLIHDDLPSMDNDDLRRGRATCHVKFDEATAILAGDVLETLAFLAVSRDETLGQDLRLRLISELAQAAGTPVGMVAGQQMDLEAEGKDLGIDAVNSIHRLKTGSLIQASAKAGAWIGDASERDVSVISDYAASLGLLFQITDDLLDVTQTTESLGKTAGKDVSSKKATYPSIYGIEETREMAEQCFDTAVGHLEKLDRDAEMLRKIAEFVLRRSS